MQIRKTVSVTALALVFGSVVAVFMASSGFGQVKHGEVQRRTLWIVNPGDRFVSVSSGDMVQIIPFSYPVVPKFLDAKIQAKLLGDRSVEFVGQASGLSASDGRSGAAAFLLARQAGRTDVVLTLTNDDVPIKGFERANVTIEVK
jgi:hypothetical protein